MIPSNTKYPKYFKAKAFGVACSGLDIAYGDYAIKALASCRLSEAHIEATRRCLRNALDRKGFVWIRAFPCIPITKKPSEVRMGSGKGGVEYWADIVSAGRILFEIGGVSRSAAYCALRKAMNKLPCKCLIVERVY